MKKQIASLARRVTRVLMKNDHLWELAQHLPGQGFFFHQRNPVIRKRAARECEELFADRCVMTGPFAGMRYAKSSAVGSMLWPKLLGTYESELRPFLETIEQNAYRQIVDVGFAEGYYLVGLGRMFENAELIGFDLEEEAKTLCHANAEINGIEDRRLKLFGGFDSERFQESLADNSLIVVDCEGFENDVIDSVTSEQRCKADWLIETHDHVIAGTTERLKLAFAQTHDVSEVTTDDNVDQKVELLPDTIRTRHSSYVQEAIVSEERHARQSWIFARRRAA